MMAQGLEDTRPALCLRMSREASFNLSAYCSSTERASHAKTEGGINLAIEPFLIIPSASWQAQLWKTADLGVCHGR